MGIARLAVYQEYTLGYSLGLVIGTGYIHEPIPLKLGYKIRLALNKRIRTCEDEKGGGDRTMSGAVDVFSMYMSSLEVCIRLEMSIIYCHQLPTSDISYSTDYSMYYPPLNNALVDPHDTVSHHQVLHKMILVQTVLPDSLPTLKFLPNTIIIISS